MGSVAQREYQPVALPVPRPGSMEYHANSLWRPGSRAFFKDQRANRVGDILTVAIDLADEANITNESTRSPSNSENADLTNFLGIPGEFSNPRYLDALKTVVAAGRRHGKGLGFMAADAATADVLATAVMVLGVDEGLRLIESEPEAACFIIDRDGERTLSRQWPAASGVAD